MFFADQVNSHAPFNKFSIYFQFQMSIEDFQPLKTLFLEKVGHGWKATSAGDVLIATRLFKFEKVIIITTKSF